ncbi:MAG: amidohydrolase family protein [Pseudomonadota bacterium]
MIRITQLILVTALSAALPALAATTAIVNATILVGDNSAPLTGATLVMRDRLIVAVGRGVAVPPGATVIDGAGKTVTPGMFAASSAIGASEITAVSGTNDRGSSHKRYSAALDMADAFNPLSVSIPVARVDGITRALVSPLSRTGGRVLVGMGPVVSLGSATDWLTKPRAAMFAEFGETGAGNSGTRATMMLEMREAFEEARSAAPAKNVPNLDSLLSQLDLAALRPVLQGQVPLVASADRVSDIQAVLRLARQYKLRLVINGGAEAWMVARELAAAKVPVILDPDVVLPVNFESLASRPDNAKLLHEAGVMVVLNASSGEVQTLRNLRQLAGHAVNNGLDPAAALAAITLNPAKVYGIDKQLGSLAAGKLADVVVWDGDPFEMSSHPSAVFISGERMSTTTRQSGLRDKYMRMHGLK